jgi:hypothetical protein
MARGRALYLSMYRDLYLSMYTDLYLSMFNTHKRQISMPPARFEPAIPASERPQTHAFVRAATGICNTFLYRQNIFDIPYGAFSIV